MRYWRIRVNGPDWSHNSVSVKQWSTERVWREPHLHWQAHFSTWALFCYQASLMSHHTVRTSGGEEGAETNTPPAQKSWLLSFFSPRGGQFNQTVLIAPWLRRSFSPPQPWSSAPPLRQPSLHSPHPDSSPPLIRSSCLSLLPTNPWHDQLSSSVPFYLKAMRLSWNHDPGVRDREEIPRGGGVLQWGTIILQG